MIGIGHESNAVALSYLFYIYIYIDVTLPKWYGDIDLGYNAALFFSILSKMYDFSHVSVSSKGVHTVQELDSLSSRAPVPSIMPSKLSFSRLSALNTRPRYLNCLCRTIHRTCMFVLLGVHGTLSLLIKNHISVNSKRFSISLNIVQFSNPYNSSNQT